MIFKGARRSEPGELGVLEEEACWDCSTFKLCVLKIRSLCFSPTLFSIRMNICLVVFSVKIVVKFSYPKINSHKFNTLRRRGPDLCTSGIQFENVSLKY